MESLRRVALDCGLEEELKWGKPCYTFGKSNVAIIQPFQEACALMFFQGALLDDPDGQLERPGPNSHAARRMMFSGVDEIVERDKHLSQFISQAIEFEKEGRKVGERQQVEPYPEELNEMFGEVSGLEEAFSALTPGRQRGYLLHFSGAQQAKTRRSRIRRVVPRILGGKGLRD